MDKQLWKYIRFFKESEFESYSDDGKSKVAGSASNMDVRFVFAIDALRGLVDRRFDLTSAYRTPSRNRIVGGAPKSAHVEGLASDIKTIGWTDRQKIDLIIYARKLGFNGIGIDKTFIHIDMKERIASWIYPAGGGQKAIPIGDEAKYV